METGEMMEYKFFALRYIHDAVTQEFVNVGVVLYSESEQALKAKFTTQYRRLSGMFGAVDGDGFRSAIRYMQGQLDALAEHLRSTMFPGGDLRVILAQVLPEDASALQFHLIGGGLSRDLDETLQSLYNRHVARYSDRAQSESRTDEDVWKAFRTALDSRKITAALKPKTITAPDYEYEFARAWQNGHWNLYEPISLDLADAGTILEKANSWLGKATTLRASSEDYSMYLLLGAPHREGLETAFNRAQNILRRSPDVKLVLEDQADAFAANLAKEMTEHGVLLEHHHTDN
jgi:hypothetical protein